MRAKYVEEQKALQLPAAKPRPAKPEKKGKSRKAPRQSALQEILSREECRWYPKAEALRLARNAIARRKA